MKPNLTSEQQMTDLQASYESWYRLYYSRVNDWTSDCSVKSAEVVLMLPDLLQLLVHLSSDARLSAEMQNDFVDAAKRFMRGIEFLPEHVGSLPSLLDDVIKIATFLDLRLPKLNPDSWHDHWKSRHNLRQTITYLLTKQEHFAPRC